MKLDRRHKRYASVLGLAVAALVFDRFVLGPGEASAGEVAEATAAQAMSAGAAPVPASTKARRAGLEAVMAGRLANFAAEHGLVVEDVPNAFEAPEGWIDQGTVIVDVGDVPQPGFASRHQLQAAMANGADSIAIIDGRKFRLGDTLDGMRLTAVRARAVEFKADDGRVVLLPLE